MKQNAKKELIKMIRKKFHNPDFFEPCVQKTKFALFSIILEDDTCIEVVMTPLQRNAIYRSKMRGKIKTIKNNGYVEPKKEEIPILSKPWFPEEENINIHREMIEAGIQPCKTKNGRTIYNTVT